MKGNAIKIVAGSLSIALVTALIIRLGQVPGGIILPGIFLGGMLISFVILGCLILTFLVKLFFREKSFLTIYFITIIISFSIFHYVLYSPTVTIVVPENYSGEVNLVLSNVKENILKLDSNGIGYLNEWTFNKMYTRPIVVDVKGKSMNQFCIGFADNTFWAIGTSCCIDKNQIKTISFKIRRKDSDDDQYIRGTDVIELADRKLIKLIKLN